MSEHPMNEVARLALSDAISAAIREIQRKLAIELDEKKLAPNAISYFERLRTQQIEAVAQLHQFIKQIP